MTALPRGIGPALVTVCVLHGLLLWLAFTQRSPVGAADALAPVMVTRWVVSPLAPPPLQPQLPPLAAPAGPQRATARGTQRVPVSPPALPVPGAAAEPTESAQPPQPAEPAWAGSIERAARDTARVRGLAVQSDERLGQQSADAQAGLRAGVASAAHSDCLKGGEGGYARSGMGLLALPMLAMDLAAGRCAK
ncbi:MAG TPA: hypothetical protein VHQ87_08455 [Rhizobacter sp.]|nr:hypothetical protein [Rhizobacter sp.]